MINRKYMYENEHTKAFLEFAEKQYYREEKATVHCIDRGIVLPLKKSEPGGPLIGYGGVLDANDNYVMSSAQVGKGDTLDRFVGKYEYNKQEEVYQEETVVYIGALPPHWGHFLVDMTYRFWYFLEEDDAYPIVYCSDGFEITGVYLDFFKLLGISADRLRRIDKPTRFRQIIIPQPAYMACDYYTMQYRSVFQRIIENVNKIKMTPYEKIYLSRGHFKDAHGKEIGEKNIEYNFQKNGFQVLYMEELSLAEQIFYINHSKQVAALSGTLCHNILFAGEETKLIILNKTHIINTHQVLIDQMLDISVNYVDVYREPYKKFPVSYGGGPFLLDSSSLKNYFKDENLVYYPERKRVVFVNRLVYTKMCFRIMTYKAYEKLYYKLCEHKYIIGFLRKIKTFAGF